MHCPYCKKEIRIYRNPVPTVDIIIEIGEAIVLIKRKNPPHGWALPGGFVDYGESYETAALREAKEETGLAVENLQQFRTYSDPDRDPRQHTASTIFIAQADAQPIAGDDAAEAKLFTEETLPELAFDHDRIISDYFIFKEKKGSKADNDKLSAFSS
ncbi:MAG: NUDIX hydrolase [Desulfocapsa sp.]|nr:NUDIX hydrolase [Desulfocapsa sp.]